MANATKQVADNTGDYDNQFWSSVAISGLDMLKGDSEAAVQGVLDACAVPSATLFNLRWFEERLNFLQKLDFESGTVGKALAIVQNTLKQRKADVPKDKWKRVVVFQGYPTRKENTKKCKEGEKKVHITRSIKESVEREIKSALDSWKVGEGDLAMCAASTEFDMFFGQECLQRGAYLRVLVLEPTRSQLADEMMDPDFGDWTTARSTLVSRANEVWYHRDELGVAADTASLPGRHYRWILNTAKIEADNASDRESRLRGLVLSDRSPKIDDPEDPAFFITEIRSLIRYQGTVRVIDVLDLAEHSPLSG